jgi:hypothetical protein
MQARVAVEGEYEDEGSLAEELSEVLSDGEARHAHDVARRVVPLLDLGTPQRRGEVVRALLDRLRRAALPSQTSAADESPAELPLQDLRDTALALLHYALGGTSNAATAARTIQSMFDLFTTPHQQARRKRAAGAARRTRISSSSARLPQTAL